MKGRQEDLVCLKSYMKLPGTLGKNLCECAQCVVSETKWSWDFHVYLVTPPLVVLKTTGNRDLHSHLTMQGHPIPALRGSVSCTDAVRMTLCLGA
jgi:hypothetical protein